ncbi:1-phosphatidylinositol 3-phosphate 5-kinase-like [Asterias amurensis]|uniref:1-phosphatidylinositol 3-phosphate 5-kinase-like n=1 Tax=Asterias amurensis TaxID=7602 RepID=UPI003AB34AA0
MDPRAVYQKNSEEISTNLFRDAAATPQPIMVVDNEGKKDEITWFRRLSPDQKTSSRFSLPEWLRRSKGGSPSPSKEAAVSSSQQPQPQTLQQSSSLPNLLASVGQDEKLSTTERKDERGVIASALGPLADLGQKSSGLRIDMSSKQEGSKLPPECSLHQQQQQHPKLTLPLRLGTQREEDSESRPVWESGKRPPRTLSTVLRHITTVVDRSGQVPQDYRDSDFKQYWMPDSQCKECYECGEKFTTLRRRHHCRVCGQIFCRRCCNQEVPGKFMGYTGTLRVCTYCCKIVLSCAQTSLGDIKMLHDDLSLVASEISSPTPDSMTPRKKIDDSSRIRQRTFSGSSMDGGSNPFEFVVQTPTSTNLAKSISSVAQERQHLLKDSAQLRQLWLLIQHPNNDIMFQNHRFRLRTYNDCIVGSELVDWLLLKDKATHRLQAVAIGQALLDAKWLQSATSHDHTFWDEYALYRAGKTALTTTSSKDLDVSLTEEGEINTMEDNMEPVWFREIDQEDKGNLTDDDGLAKLTSSHSEDKPDFVKRHRRLTSGDPIDQWNRGRRPSTDFFTGSPLSSNKASMENLQREPSGNWDQEGALPGIGEVFPNGALYSVGLNHSTHTRGPVLSHGWLDMESVSQENGEKDTLETLVSTSSSHLERLVEQQLTTEGLDLTWAGTIQQLAQRICAQVKPDVMNGDDMDIRHYVHIKKVPGGSQKDCLLVNGTICTKNIADKKMLRDISNPRILLLQSAIEHQRVENKFSSIDPIVLQEHEYLKNCVSRIASLKPNILIVEKTVAQLARTFLLHNGITLVLNMKPSVMERLSRFTEVSLIPSTDHINQNTPMGYCHMFHLQKYELPKGFSKTLMFFEGCRSHLGCSVLLRGGDYHQLKKVKKVLQFVVYARYHSRLEISFLMDEFAKPPSQPTDTDPKTIISPESNTAMTPTLGVSDSISEGLATVQDSGIVVAEGDQVDIVSEQSQVEEQEMKDEVDAARMGFRATMSSMKKLLKSKVTNAKTPPLSGPEQDHDNHHEDSLEVARNDRSLLIEQRLLREAEEDVVDQQSASPKKLPTDEEDEENSMFSSLGSSKDRHSPQEAAGNQCPTQESVTSLRKSGSVPEFDHEAMTKDLESKFLELRRHKLASVDNASMGSLDDIAHMTLCSPTKSKSSFNTALSDELLSISPHVKFNIPYLEGKAGKESPLRHFFPTDEFYWSPKLAGLSHDVSEADTATQQAEPNYGNVDRCSRASNAVIIKPPHPFTFSQLTEDAKDETTRSLLANFRARGGRIIQQVPPLHPPVQSDNAQTVSKGNQEKAYRRRQDCLDIYSHQRLLLQFCSYSHLSSNVPNHCVTPWTVTMEFYSRNDLTLGEFLERYCFSAKYKCPNELCDAAMADHIRRFVHGNASIHVLLRHLESAIPGFTDKILMWSWCRKCRQVTPVQPMSLDSWHMSFGKYLELRFHCKEYGRRLSALPCGHSLHRHHYQYFGQHNIVASFKYSPILLREVCLPPLPLDIQQAFRSYPASFEEFNILSSKGSHLLRDIYTKINAITGVDDTIVQAIQYLEKRNVQFMTQYQVDNNKFCQKARELQTKISNLSTQTASSANQSKEITNLQLDIEDCIVNVKQFVSKIAMDWNNRFSEFILQEKERNKRKSSPSLSRQELSMATAAAAAIKEIEEESPTHTPPSKTPGNRASDPPATSDQSAAPYGSSLPMVIPPMVVPTLTNLPPDVIETEESYEDSNSSSTCGRSRDDSFDTILPRPRAYHDQLYINNRPSYGISPGMYAGLAYRPIAEPSIDAVDHDLAIIEMPDPEPAAASPSPTKEARLTLGPPTREVNVTQVPKSPSKGSAVTPGSKTEDTSSKENGKQSSISTSSSDGVDQPDVFFSSSKADQTQSTQSSSYKSKQANSAMKAFFNTLMSSSDMGRVDSPYPPEEHHILPQCTVTPIIIYDQEPSSIIAYALSSEQYKTQLYELQQPDLLPPSEAAAQADVLHDLKNTSPIPRRHMPFESSQGANDGKDHPKRPALTRKTSKSVISFLRSKIPENSSSSSVTLQHKDDSHVVAVQYQTLGSDETSLSSAVDSKDEPDFDFFSSSLAEKRNLSSPHIELQFTDAATNTQFFCLVYHADQFLQLRKYVFPAGEETYIRSLSRSVSWLAQGGKSRSKFLKTKDDRFVLKQISRLEFQSFKEFAPHYFKYIEQANTEQRPTTLAKILGVYKVGYQNPITNTAQKHVLLIMENLFYQRQMGQVFDLKGSIRNRHVKTTGQEPDLVLMDENLLKHMVDSPLFIRSHSKAALTMAVHYDSMFLAKHFIMDYSLLVGLDAKTEELVVGIIDYIRTFTWDKKLEMMVKSTGIVGGQGKMPTVVSPELYRTRFCEAMDKYFLLVPDRWTNLGSEF